MEKRFEMVSLKTKSSRVDLGEGMITLLFLLVSGLSDTCIRCKQAPPHQGDSWCLGCSLELLGSGVLRVPSSWPLTCWGAP